MVAILNLQSLISNPFYWRDLFLVVCKITAICFLEGLIFNRKGVNIYQLEENTT